MSDTEQILSVSVIQSVFVISFGLLRGTSETSSFAEKTHVSRSKMSRSDIGPSNLDPVKTVYCLW